MSQVRSGPLIGLIVQFALLAALAATAGLGAAGWLTGAVFGFGLCAIVWRAMARAELVHYGPADWVTQTRASLVGCVTALVADGFVRPAPVAILVTLASVALALDLVDGRVARRTRTASEFGARYDMEVDAFLIFVLSVHVSRTLGWWVLVIGVMRYAYVAARWVLPLLRASVPPRYWNKVVAAIQGVVLTAAASGLLPTVVSVVAAVGALVLLVESFGREIVLQVRLAQARVDIPGPAQRAEPVKQRHKAGRA
ncbi:MAG TPA: CDP-alcohol phosphatidyltransferase family protein [Candidatus Limnocylindrales bacterium]